MYCTDAAYGAACLLPLFAEGLRLQQSSPPRASLSLVNSPSRRGLAIDLVVSCLVMPLSLYCHSLPRVLECRCCCLLRIVLLLAYCYILSRVCNSLRAPPEPRAVFIAVFVDGHILLLQRVPSVAIKRESGLGGHFVAYFTLLGHNSSLHLFE